MSAEHKATGKGPKWMGIILLLVALLLASAGPGDAWRGGRGFGGPRGFRGSRVFIGPRVVVPFGLYWDPFWPPYAYPPVVAVPSTQVYVQPSPEISLPPPPPPSWYYCENPQGYYPHVQQCPGGWRQVASTPPHLSDPVHPVDRDDGGRVNQVRVIHVTSLTLVARKLT